MSSNLVLYRFFDAEGTLLYVGITMRTWDRMRDHRHQSPFFPEVASVTFQRGFATVGALRKAEAQAIRKERPRFNVQHVVAPKEAKTKPGPKSQHRSDKDPNLCGDLHYCGPYRCKGTASCMERDLLDIGVADRLDAGDPLEEVANASGYKPAVAETQAVRIRRYQAAGAHGCWECPAMPERKTA